MVIDRRLMAILQSFVSSSNHVDLSVCGRGATEGTEPSRVHDDEGRNRKAFLRTYDRLIDAKASRLTDQSRSFRIVMRGQIDRCSITEKCDALLQQRDAVLVDVPTIEV